MEKSRKHPIQTWIQAIGLGFLALLLTFSIPTKTEAFSIFNGDGNDGYYLSLTNDPANVRIVPVAIYDRHPHRQSSKAFIEYNDIKVNYHSFDYNKTKFPSTIKNGEDGRKEFIDWARNTATSNMSQDTPLVWTFPSFAGRDEAKDYTASQADLDRAIWVGDTLVQDFNNAISLVHRAVQRYGNKDLENMSNNQFANMIMQIAEKARAANYTGKPQKLNYHGVTFTISKGMGGKNIKVPKGVPKDAYVTFTLDGHPEVSGTYIEYVPKGYKKDPNGNQDLMPMYLQLNGTFQKIVNTTDKDRVEPGNLNWKLVALQSNSNWAAENITFTNIGDITKTSKLEQSITDLVSNLLSGLRQMLGMYSASELILNSGHRSSDAYYNGIMPQVWMTSANLLHWISYAIAWMLIIGSIVKLLVQRNLAAINPSARVDMINGIKNLMIVGFALSIFDLVFAGLTELNFMIVDMLASSGGGVEQFGKAPISNGMLASLIVAIMFFCLDVYFNFFYIARALMIAILFAVGPLYVASIAYGEKYRQIFSSYVKELIGNIFVQSFQAVLVVFFAGVSIFGNLRTIETLVLLFCFIPMTRFFKESVGASGSTADAMSSGVIGAGAGFASGLVSSQFSKNKLQNQKGGAGGSMVGGEGGADIRTKSGSSFGGGSTQGGGVKSMVGVGLKNAGKMAAGAGMTMVGAGLVAGGAASGISAFSTVGGFAIAKGGERVVGGAKNTGRELSNIHQNRKQEKEAKKNAEAFNLSQSFSDRQGADGFFDRKTDREYGGSVDAEAVYKQEDGSEIQSYNKAKFSDATGITSMRDLDNIGDEMEIGTNYVQGEGFVGSIRSKLQGSHYEKQMGDLVEAFQNQDTAKMNRYRRQGIKDVRVDRNSGRVSLVVDKKQVGIQGVYNSGDNIHIHRGAYNRSNNKHFAGDSNPLKDLLK